MGNSLACFCCGGGGMGAKGPRRRHVAPAALPSDPAYDEGLGHSFCYVRPEKLAPLFPDDDDDYDLVADAKTAGEESAAAAVGPTTFRAISGAALSANVSTPLSTSVLLLLPDDSAATTASSGFESSGSFAAVPLQPVPRSFPSSSGPVSSSLSAAPFSGGFLSGPIERGFLSGPLDPASAAHLLLSGPLPASGRLIGGGPVPALRRSLSHGGRRIRDFTRAILARSADKLHHGSSADLGSSPDAAAAAMGGDSQGLQWAQGKAGEDRVHVVVSDERGWVFVGIYDGFNGPDATDFLVSNLYAAVHRELRGLLWEQQQDHQDPPASAPSTTASDHQDQCTRRRRARRSRPPRSSSADVDDEQRRWKCEWEQRDGSSLKPPTQHPPRSYGEHDHIAVLKALARALRKTEDAYLGIADKMVGEFPELALMGSCVLSMLMKGDDMYIMSVGDSRAVLATTDGGDDLEHVSEGSFGGLSGDCSPCLSAVQLTSDHSTSVPEVI